MPEVGKLFQNLITGGVITVTEVVDIQGPHFYSRVTYLQGGKLHYLTVTSRGWNQTYVDVT